MTAPEIEVPIALAPDFRPVGYVLERSGLWFRRPKGETWHLMKPGRLRSWCGREYDRLDATRVMHVTWPWADRGCWACMDRRWARGIR